MPSKRLAMPAFTYMLAILCLLAASPAWASWTVLGTSVDTTRTTFGSRTPKCIADGQGGMFLAWAAGDSGNLNIYAQHLDAYGQKLWPASGVVVCAASKDQTVPRLALDGAGGIFVAWKDARGPDNRTRVFAQRLSAAGAPRWLADGIEIVSSAADSLNVSTFDAARSAGPYLWVVGYFSSGTFPVVVQKVDTTGARLWGPAGVTIGLLPNSSPDVPRIAIDAGGTNAYVAYSANMGGTAFRTIAAKVNSSGILLWTNPAHSNLLRNFSPQPDVAPDGAGGAMVAWVGTSGGVADVYAQHFNSVGATTFNPDLRGALQITATSTSETTPMLLKGTPGLSPASPLLLAWTGSPPGGVEAFAAQLDTSGAITPLGNGGQVTSGILHTLAGLEPDGTGGAMLVLQGLDINQIVHFNSIRVLRINPSGTPTGWSNGPAALIGSTFSMGNACITSDGAGGALTSWEDARPSGAGGAGVYAMAVTAAGLKGSDPHWQPGGTGLSSNGAAKFAPHSVADGVGGAIVVWQDLRSGNADVYAQRVNGDMQIRAGWPSDGVLLCGLAGHQYPTDIVSDGAGGAIALWLDGRDSLATGYHPYVQRVDSTGLLKWTIGGVALCTAAGGQSLARLASDGAGGAIASWADDRNGPASTQIYAQRISAAGALLWTVNGVPLTGAPGDRDQPTLISDFSNGAIVVWSDSRGADKDIYSQRLDSNGIGQWTLGGLPICTFAGDQTSPVLCADSLNGAIIAWEDRRGANLDIYAVHVNSSGAPLAGWAAGGIPICNAPGDQSQPTLISDFSNGALIAWTDARGVDKDIYEQHVSSDGTIPGGWLANGNFVCISPGDQFQPTLISDFSNGSILVWTDNRNLNTKPSGGATPLSLSGQRARAAATGGTGADLYAQRITGYGQVVSGWPVNGAVVTNITGAQTAASAVTDGKHGLIVAWQDGRDTTSSSVYATHLNLLGAPSVAALLNGPPTPRPLLLRVSPNPSRFACTLSFQAPAAGRYEVQIVEVGGRRVRQLREPAWLPAGEHRVQWDGRSDEGEQVSSGIYFAKLRSPSGVVARRIVRLR